eukprot:495689-Pelagomonas_calceolata.AAC.3
MARGSNGEPTLEGKTAKGALSTVDTFQSPWMIYERHKSMKEESRPKGPFLEAARLIAHRRSSRCMRDKALSLVGAHQTNLPVASSGCLCLLLHTCASFDHHFYSISQSQHQCACSIPAWAAAGRTPPATSQLDTKHDPPVAPLGVVSDLVIRAEANPVAVCGGGGKVLAMLQKRAMHACALHAPHCINSMNVQPCTKDCNPQHSRNGPVLVLLLGQSPLSPAMRVCTLGREGSAKGCGSRH